MPSLRRHIVPVLVLIFKVHSIDCPTCYTHTVAGTVHCPMVAAPSPPCMEIQCITTAHITIPGPNPGCEETPTVTTYGPCPTSATCRKGCRVVTRTTTGYTVACRVNWQSSAPTGQASVTWDTSSPKATEPIGPGYSVSWDTGGPVATEAFGPGYSVSWALQTPDAQATWHRERRKAQRSGRPTDSLDFGPPPHATVSWDKRQPQNSIGVNWPGGGFLSLGQSRVHRHPTSIPGEFVSWGKRRPQDLTLGLPTDSYGFHWSTDAPTVTFEGFTESSSSTSGGYISWGPGMKDRDASITDCNVQAPPCYTATVTPMMACPMLPVHSPPCVEPACVIVKTKTIPGRNAACPLTPTVTVKGTCPSSATCRKGCEIYTKTITGEAWICASDSGPTETAELRCESTTTITKARPCPLQACSRPPKNVVCPLELLEAAIQEGGEQKLREVFPPSSQAVACPVTVTATRQCPVCGVCPQKSTEARNVACPTLAVSIAPPCVPPPFPLAHTPCDLSFGRLTEVATGRTQVERVVEKRVVIGTTFSSTETSTAISGPQCTTTPTVSTYLGCPTYSCMPSCPDQGYGATVDGEHESLA